MQAYSGLCRLMQAKRLYKPQQTKEKLCAAKYKENIRVNLIPKKSCDISYT
jgi:hypothetical protein